MYLAVDVQYGDTAHIAGVVFRRWDDEYAHTIYNTHLVSYEIYEPGKFWKRELPCIQYLLEFVREPITAIIVDAHCWLRQDEPGMGEHLYRATGIPVIGIAKNQYCENGVAKPVFRNNTAKPLWVSSSGCDIDPQSVKHLWGPYRIPKMLKLADSQSRKQ
jgi:deoxyribonuclease V